MPLNLAAVRGTDAIQRVLGLTGVDDLLVLVDDPEDLMPPPLTPLMQAVKSSVAEGLWGA